MQKTKKRVLSILAAVGLIGVAAGAASANLAASPWQFVGVTTTFGHAGLNVSYSVDTSAIFPDTTSASNLNLVAGTQFQAQQQCWSGSIFSGPFRSGALFQTSRTIVCNAANGGTAAGRAVINH